MELSRNPDKWIARRLEQAREAAGLSKAEFARALGLSKAGYTPYEQGRHAFTVADIIRFSRILGRSVAWFLGIETNLSEDEDELLTNYRRVTDDRIRQLILSAARNGSEEAV